MMFELICIGASWGGLYAVGRVLADIPAELEQPIVIAQHRAPDSAAGTFADPDHIDRQFRDPIRRF